MEKQDELASCEGCAARDICKCNFGQIRCSEFLEHLQERENKAVEEALVKEDNVIMAFKNTVDKFLKGSEKEKIMLHALKKYNERIQDSANIIPENEPVFLLRAQDNVAAETLLFWIQEHEEAGGDPTMLKLAKEHYYKFRDWPKKKLADV